MKHRIKKLLIAVLTVCLVITMVPAGSAFAAKKAKKNYLAHKKLSIVVKKTKTLRVIKPTKKVKWSTTNKKVAYVKKTKGKRRQKAFIKAGKKAGKCWIKAKVGRKVLKCRVTVKKRKKSPEVVVGPVEEWTEREVETRPVKSKDWAASLRSNPPADVTPSSAFVTNVANFSFELFKQTIAQDKATRGEATVNSSNTLISPDSVLTAMAMVENGAEGQTLTEMVNTFSPGMTADQFNSYLSSLNRSLASSEQPIYSIANSIWSHQSELNVKNSFIQKNKDYYDASFFKVPFNNQTKTDINNWVYNKTRNMIDKIIEKFPDDILMVLVNAIAFEGKWVEEFPVTAKENFTKAAGGTQKVDMMHHQDDYRYLELAGGKGFAKYYRTKDHKQSKIAFVGLLPPEGMSADAYLDKLTGTSFVSAWNNAQTKLVDVKMPKFSYDYSTSMKNVLQSMGIKKAFTNAAEFAGIGTVTDPTAIGLKISDVLHKTHIEVDEKGTKAAAVTAVMMEKATCAPDPQEPVRIYLNRSFVYALVDTSTGIPLFIGIVRKI